MVKRLSSQNRTNVGAFGANQSSGALQRDSPAARNDVVRGNGLSADTMRQPLRPAGRVPEAASVPSVVHETLRTPGQALDPATRDFMESRFQHDFSGVRIHSDSRAAASAAAVGARAYTVGADIAFAPGSYNPTSREGRQLLAHELTHVVQQGAKPAQAARIGSAQDSREQAAERTAAAVMNAQPGGLAGVARSDSAATGVVQRDVAGGVTGAAVGAVGLGAAGAALGSLGGTGFGVLGGVLGGLVGLVAGAAIGDAASTRSRALSTDEINYAHDVYLESVDYSKIRITRDSVFSVGAPRTIGNTIHLRSDWGHFVRDTLELTQTGKETLIHEMAHVWQYQNGGIAYMPQSIIAQIRAAAGSGSRNAAYDWRAAMQAGLPWERWNPEQQAEAVEDFNKLLRKSNDGTATTEEIAELARLQPYIERVRRGEGAPQFFGSSPGRPAPPRPAPTRTDILDERFRSRQSDENRSAVV